MKIRITIVSAFLGLMMSSIAGWGQGPYDGTKLGIALDRTEQVIAQAKEVVGRSYSERARALLDVALRLQDRARHLEQEFARDNLLYQAAQAGKYTLSAREKAQRALAIARQTDENEEYIRGRLERTEELLRRVQEKTGSDAPDNILLILEGAREKQQRAWELFRNRRFKMALQLTMQVEKSLERLLDETGAATKAQRQFETLQERYYTLYDRIDIDAGGDYTAGRRQIEQAEKLCREAEELAFRESYGQAEKAMEEAVRILSQAAEKAKDPDKIGQALERLNRQAESLKERIAGVSDGQLERLHRNASEHLEKADALYRAGDYETAATQLQAARQILTRLENLLD